MDGYILSWRLQNVVFIITVVVGFFLIVGIIGQVLQRFSSGE